MEFTQKALTLRAYAKINLTLEVLGERPDGYHELRTVMHSIGIFDTVTLELSRFKNEAPDRVDVVCTEKLPHHNTARKAVQSYLEAAGIDLAADGLYLTVRIKKGIPTEGGLGGASADAAAVLRGMNRLFEKLSTEKLYELGKNIGADVPFCLHGSCALCEGIGEKLTDLPPVPLYLLIVKGSRGVNTGALFRALPKDEMNETGNRSAALIAELKRECEADALKGKLLNDLAPAAERLAPEIAEYRERLLAAGAIDAMMSGSGSSVYGIFNTRAEAEAVESAFADCAYHGVTKTVL